MQKRSSDFGQITNKDALRSLPGPPEYSHRQVTPIRNQNRSGAGEIKLNITPALDLRRSTVNLNKNVESVMQNPIRSQRLQSAFSDREFNKSGAAIIGKRNSMTTVEGYVIPKLPE